MREVGGPVVAIALVLISVFVPVAFLGGLTGQFYRQFALTLAVSVGISAIVALTLTPALCALLLRPHRGIAFHRAAGARLCCLQPWVPQLHYPLHPHRKWLPYGAARSRWRFSWY